MLGAGSLYMPPRAAKILGNRIASFRGHGICFTGLVGSAMIKQNSIADTGGGGIVAMDGAEVARLSVENNDIERVGLVFGLPAAGIRLIGGDDVDISHNRIAGVGEGVTNLASHGIHLFVPKRVRIAGNSIIDVKGAINLTGGIGLGVSAGIEIAGAYGTAEIVTNDVQWRPAADGREGEWQAILIASGRPQTQPDVGGWSYQLPESTERVCTNWRRFTNYAVFWGASAFTLSSEEQALIVRSNVLLRIGPGRQSLVEIGTSGTCTFGANDCRVNVASQASRPALLVALSAETAIVDSNHLIGANNAMSIAGTSVWTVLGNVHQGAISAPGGLGDWAKFNRPV